MVAKLEIDIGPVRFFTRPVAERCRGGSGSGALSGHVAGSPGDVLGGTASTGLEMLQGTKMPLARLSSGA
jgi:hypothetical protein